MKTWTREQTVRYARRALRYEVARLIRAEYLKGVRWAILPQGAGSPNAADPPLPAEVIEANVYEGVSKGRAYRWEKQRLEGLSDDDALAALAALHDEGMKTRRFKVD